MSPVDAFSNTRKQDGDVAATSHFLSERRWAGACVAPAATMTSSHVAACAQQQLFAASDIAAVGSKHCGMRTGCTATCTRLYWSHLESLAEWNAGQAYVRSWTTVTLGFPRSQCVSGVRLAQQHPIAQRERCLLVACPRWVGCSSQSIAVASGCQGLILCTCAALHAGSALSSVHHIMQLNQTRGR